MAKSGTNSVAECWRAMKYPEQDAAQAMANEINRGRRKLGLALAMGCSLCKAFHVTLDGGYFCR